MIATAETTVVAAVINCKCISVRYSSAVPSQSLLVVFPKLGLLVDLATKSDDMLHNYNYKTYF